MEVGQGPNWGCSAKEKKKGSIYILHSIPNNLEISTKENYNFQRMFTFKAKIIIKSKILEKIFHLSSK
jgi:hypothetical protein